MTRHVARTLIIAVVTAALLPITIIVSSTTAKAVSPSLWDPGLIISDQMMYDGSAMSAAQVQTFLNQKVPTCQTGFTCLKDWHQVTPTMPADEFCTGYVGGADETAATIIAKVGASCNISQKAILVILQKEMSLVTITNPLQWRYDKAMGFACPDFAACNPAYGGFFYQVYYGARQFQKYADYPTSFNYQAGRYNNIQYSTNKACGYSTVFIANRATAGLYNYTPYQPNAAALANLYGTGDGCSAYGNRNFFRFFWDWFGSPVTSNSFLRTLADPTVYIVSGTTKYPIRSYLTYVGLSALGGVAYVTQAYLDSYATGPVVGRNFRNQDGIIALFDQGRLHPYATCDMMEDFGYSCASDQYIQLLDSQFNAFQQGPPLVNVIGTPSGGRYYIKDGTKSEILDTASQSLAGIPEGMVVLSDAAIAALPYGAPFIRDEAIVRDRDRGSFGLLDDGAMTPITASVAQAVGASTRTAGSLDSESVDQIPTSGLPFNGIVTDDSGATMILMPAGRIEVTGGGLVPVESPPFPASLLELWAVTGAVRVGDFIKSPTAVTIYIVVENEIRPISSWSAYLSLSPSGPPTFRTVPQALVARMTVGPAVLASGTLVRSPERPEIYLIDGLTSRVWVPSFVLTTEAGYNGFSYVPQALIDGYPLNPQDLGFGYQCADTKYIAAAGSLHRVSADREALYPLAYVAIDPYTCARAKYGIDAGSFIRTPNGIIYLLEAGQKRPIPNWARWLQINNGEGWLEVTQRFADLLPTGPTA